MVLERRMHISTQLFLTLTIGIREQERKAGQVMEGRLRVLESLRSNMADEAWRWYEENRSRFQHPVYVPILHVS